MASIKQMFPSIFLEPHDLDPTKPTTVTIRGIWQYGSTVNKQTGESLPEYAIGFEEFRKPARLKAGFARLIAKALGNEDPDLWAGRTLNIQPVDAMIFNEMRRVIGVSAVQPMASGPALPAAGKHIIDQQAKPKDVRPMGDKAAERFLQSAKSLGGSWDGALAYAKSHSPETHEVMYGREIADVPLWAAAVLKQYLDHLEAQKPVTEDDIPF